MLTLTLRHDKEQPLDQLLPALSVGWKRVQQNRQVRKQAESLGVVGFVRRTEITHGYRNGWHPHMHILVFAELGSGKSSAVRWDAWTNEVRRVWKESAVREGLKAPSHARGLDLKVFEFRGEKMRKYAEVIASQYLTKGGTFVGAAREFTDADGKRAKNSNRTSWELLAVAMDSGRHTAIALWQSYEDATRSKHGWAISKSLRKLAEEVEVEVEPEEMPERYEVGYIKAAGWHKMVGDHRDFGQLLTVVEKAWERELNRGSGEAAALRAASLALEDKLKRWGVGDYFCSPLVPAMAVEVSAVFA